MPRVGEGRLPKDEVTVTVRPTRSDQVVAPWTEVTGALVGVAAGLAMVQVGLDAMARLVETSAVPALVSFHVAVLVGIAVASAVAGAARGQVSGRSRATVEGPLLIALVAVAALVAGRAATSTAAPTVRWLVPLSLVVPVALVVDLVRRRRRDGLTPARTVGPHLWAGMLGLAGVGAAILPLDRGDVHVRAVELAGVGVGAVAVASMGAVVVHRRGARWGRSYLPATAVGGGLLAAGAPAVVSSARVAVASAALVLVVLSTLGLLDELGAWSIDLRLIGRRVRQTLADLLDRLAAAAAPRFRAPVRSVEATDRWGAAVLLVASVAYLVLHVGWAMRTGWQPTGNVATVMVQASDVGTAATPLIGTPTSLGAAGGAAHPGPLLFDLLAPFARLGGIREGGFLGTALIHLASWAAAVWAAFRAGGRAVAVAAWLTGALVLHVAAMGAVWEPFNVSAVLLATFAALVCSWAAAAGTWRAWPWAVGFGSLTAQAYLPHALLVVGPVLWSGLVLGAAFRAGGPATGLHGLRSALRGGLLVAAMAWLQPALDVVVNNGGNLRALAEQLAHPRPAVGAPGAVLAVGWLLALPPRWGRVTDTIAGAGSADRFLAGSVIPGLALAALFAAVWWRRRAGTPTAARPLHVVAALVLVGSALNVSQLPEDNIRSYTVVWLVVASLFLAFTIAATVLMGVARRWPTPGVLRGRGPRWIALGTAAALVVAAGFDTPTDIADVKSRSYAIDSVVPQLTDQVADATADEEVVVLGMDTQFGQYTADTVASDLIFRGTQVLVEPGIGNYYGVRRMAHASWSGPMLWVVNGSAAVPPAGHRVARVVPDRAWRQDRFDEVAGQVARWVARHPQATLEPGAESSLVKYLAGWLGDEACDAASLLQHGRSEVASLPSGALMWLYADGGVLSAPLPPSLRSEVESLVSGAPIEVWRVEPLDRGAPASDQLLRSGSKCER